MTPELAEHEKPRERDLIDAALAVNAARSLDEAFAVLAETGVELLGSAWMAVVVWDAALAEGRVHAAAGDAKSLVGIPVSGSDELRNAIRSGIAFNGHPDLEGFDEDTAKTFGASVVVRVPLSIEGCRATFHAGWRENLSPDETDRATQLLATLTRLSSLAERTRRTRELARLDTVLEGVADGVILTTENGVTMNTAARRLLAVPEGMTLRTALLNPRTLDGEPFLLDPSLRPGEAMLASNTGGGRFRIRCTALDGTELIVDGSVAPVEGGAVITFRDVTAEYRREFLNEQYIRALFDAIPEAIVVRDPKTLEVIGANRAFVRLVGLSLEQVLGSGFPAPWWADDRKDSLPEIGETAERLLRTAEGRTFPAEVSMHAVEGEDGMPALLFSVVTDLSERRRLEQQVAQSGKLAAIGELAAGVAHEINNPLFAILGLNEFLLMEAEPGSKAHERLQLIQQTGLEIKEIVRGLLDFARDTTDDKQLVSATDIVRSTLDLVRRTNVHKGIEFVEHYNAEDATVSGNANQLKQLVLNLVANARDAMPNGGVVAVDVRREAGEVVIDVTDEGPGVPPELVTRIFEPFFTTRRGRGGTGLGLPVSLGIAESHGGTLTVATLPGHGATFSLRLPFEPGGR